jgi:hypothetical protein
VDDIQSSYDQNYLIGRAMYYFSFTDRPQLIYDNFIFSLVVQLAAQGAGRERFEQAWKERNSSAVDANLMENILVQAIGHYSKVYVHLDGLDECSRVQMDVEQAPVDRIVGFLNGMPNVKILATSRALAVIQHALVEKATAKLFDLPDVKIRQDIQLYVTAQIEGHEFLCDIDDWRKFQIVETLASSAM